MEYEQRQWEYMLIKVIERSGQIMLETSYRDPFEIFDDMNDLTEYLNMWGEEGWETVGISEGTGEVLQKLLFKKPL